MPAGTYTFTMYTITGTGNGDFTVTGSFQVTVYDDDDNLGVGDDNPNTETGNPPVIQSLGAGAPAGWNVGDTFYFPTNGAKPPASSRSALANLLMIFSPEF